jgi:hypothetical protein
MANVNWNATHGAQKRAQNPSAIILLVDDVADRPRARELEDEGVNPCDVVRQKEEPALREVFQAERSQSIERAHQWPAEKIKRAFSGGHAVSHLIMSF